MSEQGWAGSLRSSIKSPSKDKPFSPTVPKEPKFATAKRASVSSLTGSTDFDAVSKSNGDVAGHQRKISGPLGRVPVKSRLADESTRKPSLPAEARGANNRYRYESPVPSPVSKGAEPSKFLWENSLRPTTQRSTNVARREVTDDVKPYKRMASPPPPTRTLTPPTMETVIESVSPSAATAAESVVFDHDTATIETNVEDVPEQADAQEAPEVAESFEQPQALPAQSKLVSTRRLNPITHEPLPYSPTKQFGRGRGGLVAASAACKAPFATAYNTPEDEDQERDESHIDAPEQPIEIDFSQMEAHPTELEKEQESESAEPSPRPSPAPTHKKKRSTARFMAPTASSVAKSPRSALRGTDSAPGSPAPRLSPLRMSGSTTAEEVSMPEVQPEDAELQSREYVPDEPEEVQSSHFVAEEHELLPEAMEDNQQEYTDSTNVFYPAVEHVPESDAGIAEENHIVLEAAEAELPQNVDVDDDEAAFLPEHVSEVIEQVGDKEGMEDPVELMEVPQLSKVSDDALDATEAAAEDLVLVTAPAEEADQAYTDGVAIGEQVDDSTTQAEAAVNGVEHTNSVVHEDADGFEINIEEGVLQQPLMEEVVAESDSLAREVTDEPAEAEEAEVFQDADDAPLDSAPASTADELVVVDHNDFVVPEDANVTVEVAAAPMAEAVDAAVEQPMQEDVLATKDAPAIEITANTGAPIAPEPLKSSTAGARLVSQAEVIAQMTIQQAVEQLAQGTTVHKAWVRDGKQKGSNRHIKAKVLNDLVLLTYQSGVVKKATTVVVIRCCLTIEQNKTTLLLETDSGTLALQPFTPQHETLWALGINAMLHLAEKQDQLDKTLPLMELSWHGIVS